MNGIGALEMESFGIGCTIEKGDGGEHPGIEPFRGIVHVLHAVWSLSTRPSCFFYLQHLGYIA